MDNLVCLVATRLRTMVHRMAEAESGRNLTAVLLQWNGDLWEEETGFTIK